MLGTRVLWNSLGADNPSCHDELRLHEALHWGNGQEALWPQTAHCPRNPESALRAPGKPRPSHSWRLVDLAGRRAFLDYNAISDLFAFLYYMVLPAYYPGGK